MNRRKAIKGLLVAGAGGMLAYSGFKWYDWHKTPDLSYLENNIPLIAALAETIIPATDSPGAREAGVESFIVSMIRDCSDVRTSNTFIDGLKDVQEYSRDKYEKLYQDCSSQDQYSILKHFEQKGISLKGIAGKVQNRFLGKSFFTILKDYTVEGYCTSKQGATRGLSYLYIPGAYHGCLPMQAGQKAWATN